MKRTIIFSLILSFSFVAISQKNYFSITRTMFKTQPIISKTMLYGGNNNGQNLTLKMEHFVNPKLSFETGLGYGQYKKIWVSSIRNIVVPFNVNYYFGEKDRKIKFHAFAGIDLNFNTLYHKNLSSYIFIDENNNFQNATITSGENRFMPSINTGLGVSYKFNSGVKLAFNTSLFYNLTSQKATITGLPFYFTSENIEQPSSFGLC